MAIPDYETLMLPLLRLAAGHMEIQVRDATAALADEFGLSPDERAALIPSGRGVSVMHSRVGWAKTYLKQAGLLTQPRRGWIAVTARGRDALAREPQKIDNDFLERFPEFQAFKLRSRRTNGEGSTEEAATNHPVDLPPARPDPSLSFSAASPEERLTAAAQELTTALVGEVLERLRLITPDSFERLIVDLLLGMGFGGSRADAGARLGRSGDGGVDGVIREDALGLDVVYLRAKRYAADNPVGPDAIRAFVGALLAQGATKGVFVTTSRFTPAAREAGAQYRGQRLVLLDGEELARLMIDHEVGVRTVEVVKLRRVDLSDYEDEE